MWQYVPVIRRTTIELDEDLVAAARIALGQSTVRATVEEALRRAISDGADKHARQRRKQVAAFQRVVPLIDSDVLLSGDAWK
jgi:Arc/MetJ family transcription regulator